jgi:hypothetical protein
VVAVEDPVVELPVVELPVVAVEDPVVELPVVELPVAELPVAAVNVHVVIQFSEKHRIIEAKMNASKLLLTTHGASL